ncbi:d9231210-e810-41bf-9b25-17d28832bb11 [Thermothielavioides terrestris]|uniref:D9231210-e810-41bf-9b25-17d28832bb11 n=1 Tax=Thermothielavioides terrestris TaxID=2587410 RepID=A0A3S4D8G3_9PEZI|nr:d9231210-e810-41bf-9b25-17d28832bb11 [Thermothielavioides terrestris]
MSSSGSQSSPHGGNINPDQQRYHQYMNKLNALFPYQASTTAPPAPVNSPKPAGSKPAVRKPAARASPAELGGTSLMAQTKPPEAGHYEYLNPELDCPSWWSYFFAGGYLWRWLSSPHLYFLGGLEYRANPSPFTVIDGMGREKTYERPFECYIDPFTGKIRRLYVQAPDSLCRLFPKNANATWRRTPIRNASSIWFRLANLPFRLVDRQRRGDISELQPRDWLVVIPMWAVTVVLFLVGWALDLISSAVSPDERKDKTKYLPLLYSGLRYPRLARNMLENREEVLRRLKAQEADNKKAAISNYRTFRPRFLNYLVEVEIEGQKSVGFERLPVRPDDFTPYVLVAFSSDHYHIPAKDGTDRESDLEALLAIATKAAELYFRPTPEDLKQKSKAFWLSANCMPYNARADEYGLVHEVDERDSERLQNQDTYSISDIVRAAEHVIVVAGHMERPWDDGALRVWGQRVWTLPEIVLSKGDSVTVWQCGVRQSGDQQESEPHVEVREIRKAFFPSMAWPDPLTSRQLIEHYSNLHLSRLELVKIGLECLMNRSLKVKYPGDRSYALMGLLRSRPPIDTTDSPFQAFARLSLPQDSDRLMERLICLLPEEPGQSWELMRDQYEASLWDIYPDTQVCAVGENDTIVIDGAYGAQIQWSMFSSVRVRRRFTIRRLLCFYTITFSPWIFIIGLILAASAKREQAQYTNSLPQNPLGLDIPRTSDTTPDSVKKKYKAGVALTVLTLVLFILPAPYYISQLYTGKLWEVEPCFFGIEGYVPLEVIEERLLGTRSPRQRRLRWSAFGSPLSRHTQGPPHYERASAAAAAADEGDAFLPTYPVTPLDPTAPCPACATPTSAPRYCAHHPTPASLHDMSRSPMGALKPFTLVDTLNMTATLFYAARPPTVLVVGGSEGGMKRALACSFDLATGTLVRETVLRIPTRSVGCMERLPRVRIGLGRAL